MMSASSLLGLAQSAQVRHPPSSAHRHVNSHKRIVDLIERRDGRATRKHSVVKAAPYERIEGARR